jgi:transcriptional regulatory protein LevR
MSLTPVQRTLRASNAASVKVAKASDTKALTKAANKANWQKFLDQIPAEITDPAERMARARKLRTARMKALALRSSRIRAARKAAAE